MKGFLTDQSIPVYASINRDAPIRPFALGHSGPFYDAEDDDDPPAKRGGVSEEAIQRMLDKRSGDAAAVIRQLLDEAADNRKKNREQKTRIDALEKQVPKDGAVVLNPGADLDAYNAYKALGTPEEITGKIKKAADLETEIQGRSRDDELKKVAEAAGLKFTVLKPLAEQAKTQFIVKDAKDDEPQTVVVKDGDKEIPLEDYIAKTWKDFEPALRADDSDGYSRPEPAQSQRNAGGVPFRGQGTGKKPKAGDPLEGYFQQTYGPVQKES